MARRVDGTRRSRKGAGDSGSPRSRARRSGRSAEGSGSATSRARRSGKRPEDAGPDSAETVPDVVIPPIPFDDTTRRFLDYLIERAIERCMQDKAS